MTMYTPNPIVEDALREADGCCTNATVQAEGIDLRWRQNPAREEDCWRVQALLKDLRRLGGSGEPTEVVPRARISELQSLIEKIEPLREPAFAPIVEPLKRALRILTECANKVGISDTGLSN